MSFILTALSDLVTQLTISIIIPTISKRPAVNINTDDVSKSLKTGIALINKTRPKTMKTMPALNKLNASCLFLKLKKAKKAATSVFISKTTHILFILTCNELLP